MGDRQPVQRARLGPAGQRLVRAGRPVQRGVEGARHHRVDGTVHRLDPLHVGGGHLAGGHLPAAQHPRQRDRVGRAQVRHRLLPLFRAGSPQGRHPPILTGG